MVFLGVIFLFSVFGSVSAANVNWTVNPGSSIQAAVNNASNGDIIIVNDANGSAYTYTENIIINKTLNLQSNSSNVTVQAYDASKSVFTINLNGSGSIITGFTITGGTGFFSSGIRLNSASNCTIQSNKITRNRNGLCIIGLSSNNNIFNNYIQNNTCYGICLYSKNNTLTGNNISNNYAGIWIYSRDNLISRNIVSNNGGFGIYIEGSNNNYLYGNIISNNNYGVYFFESNFEMHFNQIFGNQYGVYSDLAGFLNATNNWWGSNNPTITSSNTPADIVIYDGTVTYDPWLVLKVSGAVIHVTHNNTSNSQITADITHNNHGQDTSGSGTIPDGLPVNFTTNLGTITPTGTTRRGQATVTLTSSPSSGATTVNATLDGQTVSGAFRKSFSTIQAAVEDVLTVDGDIIMVENGTYTENIVVDKKLGIFSDGNVTVRSGNPSSPTFTINSSGSDSVIEGFTITQYTSSYGILLNSTNECYILNNILTLTGGISLYNSHNNTVSGNILDDNAGGIYLTHSCNNTLYSNTVSRTMDSSGIMLSYYSIDNTIVGNDIERNGEVGIYIINHSGAKISANNIQDGISIITSENIQICENDIRGGYGIRVYNSLAEIHFNRIVGTSVGLITIGSSVINATNNWWGSNSPIVSTSYPSDIFIFGGTVTYDPWLVLSINTSSVNSGGNASVTADLTYNSNGTDTSPQGHVPDNVTINFITNLGIITTPSYTRNGKATSTFNRGTVTSGTATITITLDGQTAPTNITITEPADTTAPIVTASLAGGIYNTTQTVTLNSIDNLDSDPVVYYSTNNGSTWYNQVNSVTLNLSQGITNLKFYARDSTGNTCVNQTVTYIIDLTAPTVTANLASGIYNTAKTVTLTATDNLDPNPTIYYTTNGCTPTTSSTRYTNSINITSTTTLKFMAIDNAGNTCTIQTITYTIDTTAPTVTANIAGGTYNTTKSVTLTATDNLDANPIIYYSINNSISWNNHVKTITLNLDQGITNLKFYAHDAAGNTGTTLTITYTIDTTAPTVTTNLIGGTYNTTQTVTLTVTDNLDPNPAVYYTTNGDTPTTSSYRYTGPLTIIRSLTLKFIAVDDAGNQAPIQSQDYVINTSGQIHIQKFFSENEYYFCEELDPSLYYNYVLLDINKQIPINESGNWVTITINQQFDEPLFVYSGTNLRKVYLSNINVYVDDIQVFSKLFINGNSLQPSWYWARCIDTNLLNYFPEYSHTRYSRDFVGYDLPYIYSLNNAYNAGDTVRYNQIWQTIQSDVNITAGDIYFIQHHWLDFQNSFHFTFNYPGGSTLENVQVTYLNDPGSNFEYINLFPVATVKVNDDRYCSIQAAIDSSKTKDGDIIYVNSGIYTYAENIIVDKKVTITSTSDSPVVIKPLDTLKPVFTITSPGSGSTITGLTLAESSYPGIFLNSTQNCTIVDNVLTYTGGIELIDSDYNIIGGNTFSDDNSCGIYLSNSSNNTVYGNSVKRLMEACGIYLNNYSKNNALYGNYIEDVGIYVNNHSTAYIIENTIKNCGITIRNSGNTQIYGNDITSMYAGTGISLSNSSVEIHFNRISGFTYGLKLSNNSTANATNNWWGSNNVTYIASPNTPSTPYNIWNQNGTVIYDPWLVLDLTGSIIHVTQNDTSDSEITADLTHDNHGNDTSSSGTLPDGLPVNFTTTVGTITPTATTKRGKATVTLTSSPSSGATTITASTAFNYNQTVSKQFCKSFSTIQGAVSDTLTSDGDVIVVANGTYTENIFVAKNLTIISEGNVTVHASNPSNPVIYISKWGSGTVVAFFNLINATNNCGIYLNSATDCTIYSNNITENFNGIVFYNSTGNTILNNTIMNNENVGIGLDYSNNNTITKNNVSYNWVGTSSLDSYNNIISRNKLYKNGLYGIYINASNDEILENSITYNLCGIGLYTSADNQIHFNQIYGNTYGLFANGTFVMVNATNNWWGHENNTPSVAFTDTPADIIIYNGNVDYDPWLILTVYPTSYKVANGMIYGATITADLTFNSDDIDTSIQGCVPDGILVYFHAQYGTNTFQQLQYTLKGKASSTLVLDPNYQNVTVVMAAVDGAYNFTGVDWAAKAFINVVGSAVNASNTNQKLNFTYEIPLNDPTTWVSVLWKETSLFHGEVDLIVNGNIVKSCNVVNAAYLTYQNDYSAEVFNQIRYINGLFLNPVESTTFVPNQYLQPIINYYHLENMTFDQLEDFVLLLVKVENNFTDNETSFIKNHRREFIDLVGFTMVYPGDAAQTISIVDPDNNETISINLPGNPIVRISPMIYFDGYMEDENGTLYDVGYEGVRSFAITTTKVTNEVVQYWLDKQSLYAPGAMKAAYGTFLTSLLVIKCHDMVADQAASEFNVTWSRTTPIVVSCCDDAASTYITGEMDHRMGMDVNGTPCNVWAFRFACSLSFSPIEQGVSDTIWNTTAIGSVTMGLGERILNGEVPDLFYNNGYIVLKIRDMDDLILLVDPVTGIVRDVYSNICGVNCFHNQITDHVIQVLGTLNSSDPNVQPEWLNSTAEITMASSAAVLVGMSAIADASATAGGTGTVLFGGTALSTLVAYSWIVPPVGAGITVACVIFYICVDQGWLPPERCREIYGETFPFTFGVVNWLLYDEPPTRITQLQDAYWQSAYFLMVLSESDDTELLNDLFSKKEWKEIKKILSGEKGKEIEIKAKKLSEDPEVGGSVPPDDRLTRFLGFFVNKIREGYGKLKTGDYVGGAIDIVIGTSGIDVVVGTWFLYEFWPEGLWPKKLEELNETFR
nr:right-handed parallel beta-helix repeat-containing protein [Methanobacterium petrolearium]